MPGLFFSKNIGNIYTGALIGCLISLLTDTKHDMLGKNILMFSYGSGLASSFYMLKVNKKIDHLEQLRVNLS